MEKIILLKYGELWLKSSRVKERFLKALKRHLSYVFPKDEFLFLRDRVVVKTSNFDLRRFKYIPGISYAHVSYVFDFSSLEDLVSKAYEIISKIEEQYGSFAVRCSRSGKHNFKSKDVEVLLGRLIKENLNKTVNLTKPDKVFTLNVVNKKVYLVLDTLQCIGGLPFGSEGVCNLDDPKNLYLFVEVIKRGMYVKNMDSNLKYIYPLMNPSTQDFEVVFYSHSKEDLDILPSKNENSLFLFPFIYLSKKEVVERDKYIKDEFKNIYGVVLDF